MDNTIKYSFKKFNGIKPQMTITPLILEDGEKTKQLKLIFTQDHITIAKKHRERLLKDIDANAELYRISIWNVYTLYKSPNVETIGFITLVKCENAADLHDMHVFLTDDYTELPKYQIRQLYAAIGKIFSADKERIAIPEKFTDQQMLEIYDGIDDPEFVEDPIDIRLLLIKVYTNRISAELKKFFKSPVCSSLITMGSKKNAITSANVMIHSNTESAIIGNFYEISFFYDPAFEEVSIFTDAPEEFLDNKIIVKAMNSAIARVTHICPSKIRGKIDYNICRND